MRAMGGGAEVGHESCSCPTCGADVVVRLERCGSGGRTTVTTVMLTGASERGGVRCLACGEEMGKPCAAADCGECGFGWSIDGDGVFGYGQAGKNPWFVWNVVPEGVLAVFSWEVA